MKSFTLSIFFQILPTLALVKNAKVDDYVVGFDKLGGSDEFSTEELEERLGKTKVIFSEDETSTSHKRPLAANRNVRQSESSNSSDSDLLLVSTDAGYQ